tara:strand:+ start:162 stop:482 length:321 start_codon:yes stop_codon:yes gene_type:complete
VVIFDGEDHGWAGVHTFLLTEHGACAVDMGLEAATSTDGSLILGVGLSRWSPLMWILSVVVVVVVDVSVHVNILVLSCVDYSVNTRGASGATFSAELACLPPVYSL